MRKGKELNNRKNKSIEELKSDLIQLFNKVKALYQYNEEYTYYDIELLKEQGYTDEQLKYTFKHQLEERIEKLKIKQELIEQILQNLQLYIIQLKNQISTALKSQDMDNYHKYSHRLFKLSEHLERLYNSINRTEELIQKYYNMINDYQNKLYDNVIKTYRALIQKETNTDKELLNQLYENIENLLKLGSTENDKTKPNNETEYTENDLSVSPLPNKFIDDDRYKI